MENKTIDGVKVAVNYAQASDAPVSDEEIARRYRELKMPEKQIPNGYLRLYAKTATSADQGAIIKM